MWTSPWIRLLLLYSVQTPGRFVVALHSNTSEKMSNVSVEFRKDEGNTLQVKPKITVDILMGKGVELQCRNNTSEGSVKMWQTPFGSFEDGQSSNMDPVEINNGNLRILKTTASHSGLYYCHRVDGSCITIVPYTVNVMRANRIQHEETYMTQRLTRGTEANFSQSQFAAAVTSSVLVTFIAAFALGAFSRTYVIKCLSKTGHRMRDKTASHESRNGDDVFAVALNEQSLQFECVSFHRNRTFEDDTLVFAAKSSPRDRTPSSLKRTEGWSYSVEQVEVQGGVEQVEVQGGVEQVEVQGRVEQVEVQGRVEQVEVQGRVEQVEVQGRVEQVEVQGRVEQVEVEAQGRVEQVEAQGRVEQVEAQGRVEQVEAQGRVEQVEAESLHFTAGDSDNSGPTNPDEPLTKE
ncbi:uncharacterized protein LOC143508652 [Brachyhypopomus gauderio]|uniref:uncharacterized protein LOC143508652 n=1 Tax=Brachyhypopomus gauderio TaxID=698409 RepID=UPI00404192E2